MSRAPVAAARVPAPVLARPRTKPAQAAPVRRTPAPRAGTYSLAAIAGVAPDRVETADQPVVDRVALPYRMDLEQAFGRPLDHLVVLTGDPVAAWLSNAGADAACAGDVILLPDATASRETVAHEVVHALQNDADGRPASSADAALVPGETVGATSAAEAEATTLGRDPSAAPISQSVPTGVVALRRSNIPTTPSPSESDEGTFERGLDKAETPEQKSETSETEAKTPESAEQQAESEARDKAAADSAAPEETPNPTFEPPAAPETALSAEEEAARKAEAEAAAEAIAQADNAEGVVGAYAEAPPSVKAATQEMIGPRVTEVNAADQQEFAGNLPEFHATMTGGEPVEPVAEVAAPVVEPVVLEAEAPAPAPEPELSPVPAPEPYTENRDVVSDLKRTFAQGGADAVAQALGSVETTDPSIETSAGEKPAVPLEGETDPARIDEQKRAGEEQARASRDLAAQAVIDGRGPEQAQLRAMDELVPIAEPPASEPNALAGSPEAERLTRMELPGEVLAQFDQDLGATMQASLERARVEVGQAETDRDTQRDEAVATAEHERDMAVAEADSQQQSHVTTARESIQTERQTAIDAQAAAVTQLESDAELARADQVGAIEDRVEADEAAIAVEYGKAEVDAQAKVTEGEQEAESERVKAEQEAEEESWWDAAVSFVEDVFNALTSLINDIFGAVRSAVKAVLDAVRDFAKGLIDLAADFIKSAISAYGELLKGLIDATLGQVFPELAATLNAGIDAAVEIWHSAVDAVAETLKAGVDSIVDSLNDAINFVIDMYQSAVNAALAIMEAAITGDWSGLARKLLDAVLRLLGIDPAEFYAFIAKIVDTIDIIIDDPLGFLGNLVNAVLLGFQKFADNFLTHLKVGIIGWLTGALGGIQIPAEFNLAGVLELARQILGLTWDWVRAKAVKLVGEQNVARLEFLLSYVQTLFEGGFVALWARITEDLGGLVETVLGAIKQFLVEKVIIASITWIASLFSPVGALVKLVMTIWNLYTFVRDQLARVIQIAQTIVDGLANIALGVIENAALRVESALSNLLPVAIDLVAKLLGLTGVTAKVQQIIEDIRAWIDGAIDKLLNKVLQAFTGKGQAPVDEAGAQSPVESGIGENIEVDGGDGTTHHLTIEADGTNATAMLQTVKLPVSDWLVTFDTRAAAIEDEGKKAKATALIKAARKELGELDPKADALLASSAGGGPVTESVEKPVIVDQKELGKALTAVFDFFGDTGTPIEQIFKAEIEKTHKQAQTTLRNVLKANAEAFQTLTWPDVRAKLIEEHNPFQRPLLNSHAFGESAQLIAKDAVPSDKLASTREVTDFFRDWLVERVHDDPAPEFVAAREALRAVLFDGGEVSAAAGALATAVLSALAIKDASGEKADPLLKQEAADIVEFLRAVARKEKSYGQLDLTTWETRLWGWPPNREWISSKFRARDKGKHEWILTHLIGDVIKRNQEAVASKVLPTCATWFDLQHALRTPTDLLIFPAKPYAREVKYLRNPKTHERLPGGGGVVLQGHPGPVNAPVDKNGNYRDSVAPQTEGSPGWHDELEAIFTGNPGGDLDTMRTVVSKIDAFWVTRVWSGDVAGLRFDEYYETHQSKADGKGMTSLAALSRTGASAAGDIAKNFSAARTAVGI